MNSFGTKFRVSLFGESHGAAIGVVIDGVPAGIELSGSDFEGDLERRRSGARGTTPRRENDKPELLSGLFEGKTTGAPLTVVFRNENMRSEDYENLMEHPRPSHADFVAHHKYKGYNDYRGGGHFSGRVTLALVAAGVVAKKTIDQNIEIESEIKAIGGVKDCKQFPNVIDTALEKGDSVGGVVECVAKGVPIGLGEPFFDSVESVMSHLLFAIPAIKGVEFGAGFDGTRLSGSQNNDMIISADGTTSTNHSGGINGGITNGNPIVVRVAVKPTSSISKEQMTYNFEKDKVEALVIEGRHDACIALRMPVVIEAAMAITLAQFV